MVRAVIDVGSNSVLLSVARQVGGTWVTSYESSRVTGIGVGTKSTGQLSVSGAKDTLGALQMAFKEARAAGANVIRAAGTMALRIAEDAQGFVDAAAAQGTPVTVLSGEDEARLGMAAVTGDPKFADSDRISIVDTGGHSTEVVTVDRGLGARFARSFPIGALGVRDGLRNGGRPDSLEIVTACGMIDDVFAFCFLPGQSGTVVALGATATNLVSIREGWTEWRPNDVHGARLTYEEIAKSAGALSALGDEGRKKLTGIEPGRELTLHLGALILERAMFALRAETCQASIRGWRHAWLEELKDVDT